MIRFGFLTVCLVCHLQPTKVCNVLALFEGNMISQTRSPSIPGCWSRSRWGCPAPSMWSCCTGQWCTWPCSGTFQSTLTNVIITTSVGQRIKIENNGRFWPGGCILPTHYMTNPTDTWWLSRDATSPQGFPLHWSAWTKYHGQLEECQI